MNIVFTLISALTSIIAIFICIVNLSLISFSTKNKVSILLLITFNIILSAKLGNVFVIPLLLTLVIYIFFIADRSVHNLFIVPLSYVIGGLFCNLITLLISLIFHTTYSELTSNLYYYIPMSLITIVSSGVFSYFLGILLRKYLNKLGTSIFKKESLILIFSHISLCAIIYAFNIIWGQKVGYNDANTTFNTILFLLYFLSSTIILIITFRTYAEKSKLVLKESQFQNLQEYTANIESMYSNLNIFKHDYINILSSLLGYMESKDYDGLESYFNEKILPTKEQINADNFRLSQLANINISALKGLLSSKFIYAHELGVHVFIDISDPIDIIPIDIIDLSRILGIFLDNAIEGSLGTTRPQLNFNIVKNKASIAIIVTNNFINHNIPLSQIGKLSVSSKGSNRGLGLYNVKQILKTYKNVFHETSMHDGWFIQHLEIT